MPWEAWQPDAVTVVDTVHKDWKSQGSFCRHEIYPYRSLLVERADQTIPWRTRTRSLALSVSELRQSESRPSLGEADATNLVCQLIPHPLT